MQNYNKNLILIIIFLIVVFLGFYLIINTTILSKSNWKTYRNSRFNYSISYPSNWKEGLVATNGDGKAIYKDDLNEILVYGSLRPYSFSTQDDEAERSVFILNDGRKATSLKSIKNGKINYIIFFNQIGNDGIEEQYVLNADVTEKFFKDNEDTLNKVGKTFKFLSL